MEVNPMSRSAATLLAASLDVPVVVVNEWGRFDVALPSGLTEFAETLYGVNLRLHACGWATFTLVLPSGARSQEITTTPRPKL